MQGDGGGPRSSSRSARAVGPDASSGRRSRSPFALHPGGRRRGRCPPGSARGSRRSITSYRAASLITASTGPRDRERAVAVDRGRRARPADLANASRGHRCRRSAVRPRAPRALQVADVVDGDEPAFADDPDPVADALDLGHHVGGEEDRRAAARASSYEQRVERSAARVGRAPASVRPRSATAGRCMNAWISPTFCRLPCESVAILTRRSSSKRSARLPTCPDSPRRGTTRSRRR